MRGMRSVMGALVVALGTSAGVTVAQDLPSEQRALSLGGVRALSSADAARGWGGVGRLDTGVSFCTATLIAPDRVLTAAHCLYHPGTQERLPDRALRFQAGLRNGRPETIRAIRRGRVLPGFVPSADPDFDTLSRDLAILELELPIRSARMPPLALGPAVAPSDWVSVVSYGAGREAVASIEEGCQTLDAMGPVRVLSCHVVGGSSGAPVLRMTDAGPELVAVVSASGRTGDDVPLAIAVGLAGRLETLMTAPPAGGAGRLPGAARDGGGPRFIRP